MQASSILHEARTNGNVVLIGAMIIGAIAAPKSIEAIKPFVNNIFMGVLCLFLLEMGLEAARRIEDFQRVGLALAAFAWPSPCLWEDRLAQDLEKDHETA